MGRLGGEGGGKQAEKHNERRAHSTDSGREGATRRIVAGRLGATSVGDRIIVRSGVGRAVVARALADCPCLDDAVLDFGSGRRRHREHRRHRVSTDAKETVDQPAGHREGHDRTARVGQDDHGPAAGAGADHEAWFLLEVPIRSPALPAGRFAAPRWPKDPASGDRVLHRLGLSPQPPGRREPSSRPHSSVRTKPGSERISASVKSIFFDLPSPKRIVWSFKWGEVGSFDWP